MLWNTGNPQVIHQLLLHFCLYNHRWKGAVGGGFQVFGITPTLVRWKPSYKINVIAAFCFTSCHWHLKNCLYYEHEQIWTVQSIKENGKEGYIWEMVRELKKGDIYEATPLSCFLTNSLLCIFLMFCWQLIFFSFFLFAQLSLPSPFLVASIVRSNKNEHIGHIWKCMPIPLLHQIFKISSSVFLETGLIIALIKLWSFWKALSKICLFCSALVHPTPPRFLWINHIHHFVLRILLNYIHVVECIPPFSV